MVSYLQKMASGHLAKNANGHLVNNCDNYVVFTQCTAACPDDPPTSDCGGGDTITSTPALIWGWSASLIGSVAKVDGKCYTVEWGTDGTPAVAVTIQSTYDCCAECCTDEPNYLLTQCDISCPNTDCDGEEDSIIIAATSVLKAASCLDSDDPVVKLNGKCWHVSETCDDTTSSGSPTGPYDGCEACCDCYPCGDTCEFHPDSTLTAEFKTIETNFVDEGCTGEVRSIRGRWLRSATYIKDGCNSWTNGSVDTYRLVDGSWEYQLTGSISIVKSCTTGYWSIGENPALPFDDCCRGWWGDLGTSCTGCNVNETCCCTNAQDRQYEHMCTITVNNNDCGEPGP